ncbi:hypothetical protein NQZ68_001551 [Dissostichus eleginoides]|nr:hypothetical protein NQZ68_001551 [Dissostichus eleginoides]
MLLVLIVTSGRFPAFVQKRKGMAEQKKKKQEGSQRKMKSGDMACFHHLKDMGLEDKTFG